MIRPAIVLSALLAVGSFGTVLAQEQMMDPSAVNGTVKAVDPGTRTVVLDNGQSYMLDDMTDMTSVRAGAPVALSCDTGGANCMVVSSGTQNDIGPESSPESETAPSAGAAEDAPSVDAP
jgi:hypothetical protein